MSLAVLMLLSLLYSQEGPALFPVKELLQLLIRVIGTSTHKIQQLANTALVEVANCVSGQEGCSKIQEEETVVILDSLKSTCTASRESALQVRPIPSCLS